MLLVEDNPVVQLATKQQLEEFGCKIEVANTGEDAIMLMKKNHYNLVFMDVGLPDKNGTEVTLEIRAWEKQHNRNTPIIALTAHVDENNKQYCFKVGMNDVVIKPLTYEKAQDILNTYPARY